ncbi:MAG: DUF1592 domain-containing protein [Archangiaceae bacterium]|nr:DUF1592 domain-containing protein [Archangiaceae bacterium]
MRPVLLFTFVWCISCVGEIAIPSPLDPGDTVNPSTGGSGGGDVTGGTGGGDSMGTGGGSVIPPEMLPAFVPAPLQGRLLLSWHYVNAIRDVLGTAAAGAVTAPRDVAINGLSAIGASTLELSTSAAQQYETNAYAAAKVATLNYGCSPTTAIDDACFGRFLDSYGRRLFRRPLSAAERTTWTNVQHAAAMAYGSFARGVEFALAGLLQSPAFLYRFEKGTPEGGNVKLTPYELASRLSFFLAGTTPSDALLTAAENGKLDTADSVREQAGLLLDEASAKPALSAFFDEVFDESELEHLGKDTTTFPDFDQTLATSMREELHRMVEAEALTGDFRNLLDADHTYVDAKLAKLYGVTAPASGWQRVQLKADQPRAGILGEAAFLALKAHPVSSSPTLRGKLVREKLLCQPVAAPPPDVNTTLPEPPVGQVLTTREKVAQHMSSVSCSACHKLMDPIGFGFENFDAVGAYRTTEHGKPVDASGVIDGKSFADAKGLAALLKNDPRVMRCMTKTFYRQAAGHVELTTELLPLRVAETAFINSGYQLRSLLVELAASDAFRYGRAP